MKKMTQMKVMDVVFGSLLRRRFVAAWSLPAIAAGFLISMMTS